MTADELKQAGRALFGYGWQTRLADVLGVDGSTVRRWVSSGLPVAGSAAALLDALTATQRIRGALDFEMRRDDGPVTPEHVATGSPVNLRDETSGTEFRMPRAIGAPNLTTDDVVVMRHPDRWHLEGYLEAVARRAPSCRPIVSDDGNAFTSVLERRSTTGNPRIVYQDVLRDGRVLSATTAFPAPDGRGRMAHPEVRPPHPTKHADTS